MMAHEVPLQVRPTNPPAPKTNKHKPVPEPRRRLPNGEKPDFGHDKPKGKPPQLPNGEKPNFGHEARKEQHSGEKPQSGKKPKAKRGPKANKEPNNTNNNIKEAAKPVNYAGSSFHSSPEALALPKPSFRSSPKSNMAAIESHVQPNHYPNQLNMPPAFVYQGMVPSGPPQYPVTAYPPTGPYLPGFNYSANHQGFINYLYPPAAVPQPPLPMQSYPFHVGPAFPSAPSGQKITFNDLMGSSK